MILRFAAVLYCQPITIRLFPAPLRISFISMQHLVQRFVEQRLSRRGFTQKLGAMGLSLAAAQSILEPLKASEEAGKGLAVPGSKAVRGTGGELVMAQAKAAGAEYLFTNPGS